MSYKASDGEVYRAFLDVWDGSKPFFVSVRKTRNYVTYADEGDWPDDEEFPAILAICANSHDQKKLNRQMRKALCDSDDANDISCGATTLGQLSQATKPTDRLWTVVRWDDEPTLATLATLLNVMRGEWLGLKSSEMAQCIVPFWRVRLWVESPTF